MTNQLNSEYYSYKPYHKPSRTSQTSQNELTMQPLLRQEFTLSHATIATNIASVKLNTLEKKESMNTNDESI